MASWCTASGNLLRFNPNHSNGGVALPNSRNCGASMIGGASGEYVYRDMVVTLSKVSWMSLSKSL